jgi:hypothetical protein
MTEFNLFMADLVRLAPYVVGGGAILSAVLWLIFHATQSPAKPPADLNVGEQAKIGASN